MLTATQDNTYFHRMASSLGDKSRIVDYLTKGNVLDLGAGGGELSEYIRVHNHDVTALDGSIEAYYRIQNNYPYLRAVHSNVQDDIFKNASFDNIVACSIYHEVFSYGDDNTHKYDINNVMVALQQAYDLLKQNGRLIIRDGIMPDNKNQKITMKLHTEHAVDFMNAYSHLAPFYNNDNITHNVHFENMGNNNYQGVFSNIMEFMFTLTWGFESIERESQEIYGVFTKDEYVNALQNIGFDVVYYEAYLQKEYVTHLQDHVSLFDENGVSVVWPDSNMILVAEKNNKVIIPH